MLCPACYVNRMENKLKVVDSRPMGPFSRIRHYLCNRCGYEAWNAETLEDGIKMQEKASNEAE